jgi:hypothetical protein
MSHSIWIAIGLFLIFEGIGPSLFPKRWRESITQLSAQDDKTLQRIGGSLVVAGVVIVYMMFLRS